MKLSNIIGHTKTVLKHKWVVFKLCCKAGIPWRGLVHDLSKFSPTEFWESAKYYTDGKKSPIAKAKKEKAYSEACLHHLGRNKHHIEYWLDIELKEIALVMPYKYALEMACDTVAAGIVYEGKNWTKSEPYDYWMKKRKQILVNPKIDNFLTAFYTQVKEKGIDDTLTKKNMKELYNKYCVEDKTKYVCEIKVEWRKE